MQLVSDSCQHISMGNAEHPSVFYGKICSVLAFPYLHSSKLLPILLGKCSTIFQRVDPIRRFVLMGGTWRNNSCVHGQHSFHREKSNLIVRYMQPYNTPAYCIFFCLSKGLSATRNK